MKKQEILKWMASLLQGRMNDLEARCLMDSCLNIQIENHRRLILMLTGLLQERFSSDEAVLKEMERFLESDKTSESLRRVIAKGEYERDQAQAQLEDFKDLIEQLDEE